MAPVLTVFIGGNHEASNYLQELPYGGWAAPNIYYMGEYGRHPIATIWVSTEGVGGTQLLCRLVQSVVACYHSLPSVYFYA